MSDEVSAATSPGWVWDRSLYAGSARFYPLGRVGYPHQLVDELVGALGLDGRGRLLDVGCGPGSLTLLLAPHVAEAIGIDADADMLVEASRLADEKGVRNASWRQLRAESLPADLPPVRVATFAQSFHWLDRHRVAAAVRGMLVPGGAVVHLHATTHEGVDTDAELPRPRPPRGEITHLVQRYLGTQRRAGHRRRSRGRGHHLPCCGLDRPAAGRSPRQRGRAHRRRDRGSGLLAVEFSPPPLRRPPR